jgi:hypothetical protein
MRKLFCLFMLLGVVGLCVGCGGDKVKTNPTVPLPAGAGDAGGTPPK